MNRLKNLALAAALGLSLSANPMQAAQKSVKPSDHGLSFKAFNQVINNYDCREFFDKDGDKIESASDAKDVAHTTVYKIGGKPIAKATYDDDGHIMKLEEIVQAGKNSAAPVKPAQPAHSKPVAPPYNIDWGLLDSVIANPEYKNSVNDLYKFGFGVEGFEQRKHLIRTYLRQESYIGTGEQNEAHFAAVARLVSERDASTIGPLYEAAKKMGYSPKQDSKPAYKPAAAPSAKRVAAPTAPAAPTDDGDSDDSSAPSGDLEQKLYNAPAQTAPAPEAPAAAQREEPRSLGPANYHCPQSCPNYVSPQTMQEARRVMQESDRVIAESDRVMADAEDHLAQRRLNNYGSADQNPDLQSRSGFTAAQQLSHNRRMLRNKQLISEVEGREGNAYSRWNMRRGLAMNRGVPPAHMPEDRHADSQSLEQRAASVDRRYQRDSSESASRQARYEDSRETPSAFSSYDLAKKHLWDIRVVGSRTAVHTQVRNIHTPLAQAADEAMRSCNPYGRQDLPHLGGNGIDVNAAFTKSLKDMIVRYSTSGPSSLTQWDMEVYAGARGFMNRVFTDSRSSHRALTHYNRVYSTTWHPIRADDVSPAAINQLAHEFDTLQKLYRNDYNHEYRNPRFMRGLAKGLLFGLLF